MSVSSHLAINVDDYDTRIRTFIPYYEEMLDVAAAAANAIRPRFVVELGIGTGALASRILSRRGVDIVGIDEDESILAMARTRLGARRASLLPGSFLRVPIPQCDAVVTSFALHHIESRHEKQGLYGKVGKALRSGGIFVSADCHPSALPARAAAGRRQWLDHLTTSYGRRQAEAYLRTWALEDFYTTLEEEITLMAGAGLVCDVVWRRDSFAVLAAAAI
jgi:SAM-dependent methyltransferase